MIGYLYGDVALDIDPLSVQQAGSWRPEGDRARAWDPALHLFWYWRLFSAAPWIKPLNYLDIGANTGSFCLVGRLLNRPWHCWAIEPATVTFEILKSNISRNCPDDVTPIRRALWSKEGWHTTLWVPEGESGFACIGEERPYRDIRLKEPVVTTTLDALVKEYQIPKCHLIKIDVEGAELPILQGAKHSLIQWEPDILVEYAPHHMQRYGYQGHELDRFLDSVGYKTRWRVGLSDYYYKADVPDKW